MHLTFKDKTTLIRVDFNVPLNKSFEVTDDTRIRKALPTIQHILNEGGSVILMSHLGRPLKKLTEDGQIDISSFTLRNIVSHLSHLLKCPVKFAADCGGKESKELAAGLKPGDVLLLENTRFYKGEKSADPEFAKSLADLADNYVNDAFGTAHRAHASTTKVAEYFEKSNKCFGYLMEKEIENAEFVLSSSTKPFTAILGGAKVSDKIQLIEKLIDLADNILIGGAMAYTFAKAFGGDVGDSMVEDDFLELVKDIIKKAEANDTKIHLPVDSLNANKFSEQAKTTVTRIGEIGKGWMGLDLGPQSLHAFAEVIKKSKTILWNGPMGVFEMRPFAEGTKGVALAVAQATDNGAFSLVGGGDSVAAVNFTGLSDRISFISTGGGAMLEYLEGKELPGIKAIRG